jgi:hypothetical protein
VVTAPQNTTHSDIPIICPTTFQMLWPLGVAKLIENATKDWKRICRTLTSGPQQALSSFSNLCGVSWVSGDILSRAGIMRYLRMLILYRKCRKYSYGHINTIIISSEIRRTKLRRYFCTVAKLAARSFLILDRLLSCSKRVPGLMFCAKYAFYATSGVLGPSAPERRSSILVVGLRDPNLSYQWA